MTHWEVIHGNCLEVLRGMEENSVDSCCTDPPYELGFMGANWDRSGIAYNVELWREVLRVLKPGAHMLCFGGTRTAHRIACAIEDAGFEIRDSIATFSGFANLEWIYGEGMPKSKKLTTDGFVGTGLKPAHEPIYLARKRFGGTTQATYDQWGTGGLNINACRVEHANAADFAAHAAGVEAIKQRGGSMSDSWKNSSDLSGASDVTAAGRWPANVTLTHSADCKRVGTTEVEAAPTWDTENRQCEPTFTSSEYVSTVQHGTNGVETVSTYECSEGCPVKLLGSEARYFSQFEYEPAFDDLTPFLYQPKPKRKEKDAGLEAFPVLSGGQATKRKNGSKGVNNPRAGAGRTGRSRNPHSTVKAVRAIRWNVRLVTPPGGICLDPFTGSGTTGVACVLEGRDFIGIELNNTEKEPFANVARARIAHYANQPQQLRMFK